jgi:hypothetical protein
MRRAASTWMVAGLLMLTQVSLGADKADQTSFPRSGGISTHVAITGGSGRSAEDGLAHPGVGIGSYTAGRGVPSMSAQATNPGTDDGFHAAGMGKPNTASVGRGTMETVPGRSKTYMSMIVGQRSAPVVGGIGNPQH